MNPCGIASGFKDPNPYHAQVPDGHKPGDNGTDLPPLQGVPPNWQAGGTADVSFALLVNHGGGYQYRLCPKSSEPTEGCFQSMPLRFATDKHTIRYEDGSHEDITIPARDVSEGTQPVGSTWRRNPIPACNCDLSIGCGSGKEDMTKPYEQESGYGPVCPTGIQFEAPFAGGWVYYNPSFSIIDQLKVPEQEGDYILSWRWDCEQTPQIWNSCADITISSRPPSPGPAPAPAPAPAPPSPPPTCKAVENPKCKGSFINAVSCWFGGCQQCHDNATFGCDVCCGGCTLKKKEGSDAHYCDIASPPCHMKFV